MTTNKQRKIKTPIGAYMGFLFQTFLKRPFGYIIAVLYIVYLAVILLIVPAALDFGPLDIWNLGGFNMPMFNLFFIAGAAASIAVAVFRTGRDDGTDLALSAKPLTKGLTVTLKTTVFLIIMVIMCLTSLIIVALIKPIFGEYNYLTNITGIELSKYKGMILSVFIANMVNMLLFGGIAVFFTMVGGQVITIIGTIGVVIVMVIMNIIYPQAIKSATDILADKYGGNIISYSCNTLSQYDSDAKDKQTQNFATILCEVDSQYQEEFHLDTQEYWTRSNRESGRLEANYADFGKQLSNLFNSFGMDESRLTEASKLVIGMNNNYQYTINKDSHVTDEFNVENGNYPIALYYVTIEQGQTFARLDLVGGDMSIGKQNWYFKSLVNQYDFNSIAMISENENNPSVSDWVIKRYGKHTWNRMDNLILSDSERETSTSWFREAVERHIAFPQFKSGDIARIIIKEKVPEYDNLQPAQKFDLIAKNYLWWIILSNQMQKASIEKYCEEKTIQDQFPFKSSTVIQWYNEWIADPTSAQTSPWNYYLQGFAKEILENGVLVEDQEDMEKPDHWLWCKLQCSDIKVAETFNNFYTYSVTPFYNATTIAIVWSVIAGVLFAGSIIVYKRTDFK